MNRLEEHYFCVSTNNNVTGPTLSQNLLFQFRSQRSRDTWQFARWKSRNNKSTNKNEKDAGSNRYYANDNERWARNRWRSTKKSFHRRKKSNNEEKLDACARTFPIPGPCLKPVATTDINILNFIIETAENWRHKAEARNWLAKKTLFYTQCTRCMKYSGT